MSLTASEALLRAETVTPIEYRVDLDLTQGDEHFGSTTRLRFTAAPGTETFVDLAPVKLDRAVLNGAELPDDALSGRRLMLADLQAENELVVEATMAYSHDGQGLHRAVDPADGEAYVYGHLFMDAAPRVYACFDQPGLKAPYEVSVAAPPGWTVIANGATREDGDRWWSARTKPLATYFVTVCAGPFASVTAEHDGIPLGVHARRSLRRELEEQAPDILATTCASFDYYHGLFDIRYPFGEYHQVFVPEFNAGAMENPGCVTFRDQLIFTGAAGRSEHLARANTISHEMAHMWFGDLVTMQWWDDLWLNESFAEYMATRTLTAVTEYDDALVAVAAGRKSWGYEAERSPSTHPVAGAPAPDTDTALQNFDGISYAKGSAVLRQLIAHIGDDAFVTGVQSYLRSHAFGNASLTDFLAALSAAAGRDLTEWAEAWLRTAGMDTLVVERTDARATLVVNPDTAYPAHRRHAVQVAAYDASGRRVAADDLPEATGRCELPAVSAAVARGEAALIVPNDGDLTWAGVLFDDASLTALADVLPGITDARTRAMIWTALAHGVATAQVDPRSVLTIAERTLPHETQMPILDVAIGLAVRVVIGRFLPWERRSDAQTRMAAVGEALISADYTAGSARLLAGARLVATTGGAERVRPWFDGQGLPSGLDGDAPFRWVVAQRLAQVNAVSIDELDAALAVDDTMSGRLGYLTARAAFPDPETKQWAWQELTSAPTAASPAHSNYEMNALASGFWSAEDEATLASYVERYVADIPAMSAWVGEDALARVATRAFPSGLAGESLDIEARRMLSGDLPESVRRAVVDQRALLDEVLASRQVFQGLTDESVG